MLSESLKKSSKQAETQNKSHLKDASLSGRHPFFHISLKNSEEETVDVEFILDGISLLIIL